MNLKCLICSDLFTPASEIHTTICGHLFHYVCLAQWLERSRSCPQCRSKATEKTIHKVYLSVEENPEHLDASTLQLKLDNAQFQLTLKNKDVVNLKEKYSVSKKQNEGLRDEVKTMESKSRVMQTAVDALKEQVNYFKAKSKDAEKLRDEVKRLKQQLENLDDVRMVITGSTDEVNDMLRHNNDAASLSILVATLKKELVNSNKRTKQFQHLSKEFKNELQEAKRTLTDLTRQKVILEKDVEALSRSEKERVYLKKKIEDLQLSQASPSIANSSIIRIVKESPAPFEKVQTSDGANRSLSLPDKIKEIKDSDSPFLRVQSSSVGLTSLMNHNKTKKAFSFKSTLVKPSSADIYYDGLGGHSKDEKFPSPNSRTQGLKRQKPSTIASAKFRKLAPNQRFLSFDKT